VPGSGKNAACARARREGWPGGGLAGTDALSHQLGLARVRLGMNMAATALPAGEAAAGAQPEDVVVYFGIIDILQARAGRRARTCSARAAAPGPLSRGVLLRRDTVHQLCRTCAAA